MGDARLILAEPNAAPPKDGAATPSGTQALPWIAAALGLGLGLFGLLRAPAGPGATSAARTVRFTLLPEPKGDLDGFPAISPDGQTIVFGLVPESGVSRLWALSLATGDSRLLPDTEYASEPFWSPDGRFIAFFSRGQLRRLELSTGLTRALAGASDPRGGAWSETGDLFFTPNSAVGLFRVSSDGGAVTPATDFDSGRGRWVLYASRSKGGSSILRKPADGSGPEETLYVHPDTVFADWISPREPLAVLEASKKTGVDLWLLPLEGDRKGRPFVETPASESHGSFSADGRLIAYSSDESGLSQIYAKEIGGSGNRFQLTTDGGDQALWSADGKEIFYVGFDRAPRALGPTAPRAAGATRS